MKVGLDHIPLTQLLQWDLLQFMENAAEYGYEGVAASSRGLIKDEAYRQQVIEKKEQLGLYMELGGAGIDSALSGRSTTELVKSWGPLFELAVELGVKTLITGLGTWPWQGRVIKEEGKSVADQIKGGIATLKELSSIAQDHEVAVTIHTSFFTANEYVEIMEAVDSPYVGLCVDTANAFLVLEDPTEFAQKVAPWAKSTHFKDSAIYLQPEGVNWLGGCPLGRGSVDIPTVMKLLYQANPEINLSIEDHWGRTPMPAFDKEFLNSIPGWDGSKVANLLKNLQQGESLLRAGLHPTPDESKNIDWKKVFPGRARYNATYAKQLRDEIVSGDQKESE
ncbi:sugar phosphate isomerase/epimerase family protein [Candidatus Poribacteria bacterium]